MYQKENRTEQHHQRVEGLLKSGSDVRDIKRGNKIDYHDDSCNAREHPSHV